MSRDDGSYRAQGLYCGQLAVWGLVALSVGARAEQGCRGLGRCSDAGHLFAGGQPGGGLFDTGSQVSVKPSSRLPAEPARQLTLAEVVLVNQRACSSCRGCRRSRWVRRVRFTNQDGETHNVHVVSPGFAFNQSMAPGQFHDFTPDQPGVMRLACDIHHHMRGFVVVSPTPWVQVCDREGRFRLRGVPDGRYVLDRLARDG